MNVLVLIVEALGIVAMVLVHRHQLKGLSTFFSDRLREQDEVERGRQLATYKMAKANERRVAQSDRAVRKMVDQTRHLHDEITLAQQRTDALARDVKEGLHG